MGSKGNLHILKRKSDFYCQKITWVHTQKSVNIDSNDASCSVESGKVLADVFKQIQNKYKTNTKEAKKQIQDKTNTGRASGNQRCPAARPAAKGNGCRSRGSKRGSR